VSSRLRCLRTKTDNACSALRPFARQGHLVGTVAGPLRSSQQGSSLSILTEPHDRLAPPNHSITSSARAISIGGSVSPRILAVSVNLTSPSRLAYDPRGNLKSTARPTAPKFARSKSKRAASARHRRPCRRDRKRHGGRNDAYFAIPLVPCCCMSCVGVRPSPRSP
jgi:hypothetical protein